MCDENSLSRKISQFVLPCMLTMLMMTAEPVLTKRPTLRITDGLFFFHKENYTSETRLRNQQVTKYETAVCFQLSS